MEIAPEAPLTIFGMSFNMMTLYMSWVVIGVLLLGGWLATRRMTEVPSRWQLCMELFVGFFDSLTQQTLGERGRKYLPFIGTIFLFVWGCNLIGLIPGFEEPTRDLNTTIGLAVLAIGTAQISGMVVKGFRSWWWEFFEPSFPGSGKAGLIVGSATAAISVAAYVLVVVQVCTKALPGLSVVSRALAVAILCLAGLAIVVTMAFAFQKRRVPNVFMAPLNVVGEVGKSISLPFRLYGNIFGGAVILIVVSYLAKQIVFPVIINLFFGLLIGTIQAFVFAMLSLTYTAVAIAEQEE